MDRARPHKGLDTTIGENSSSANASCTPTASSSTTTPSFPSPKLPMPHVRSKTTSQVDVVGQGKRLSLQFPIASPNSTASSPRSRPASWIAPSSAPSLDGTSSPAETNILAVLAAQERFVLELKEELNKAEADLKTLKKHYALHEANKRRNDVRKVAQLQPVNTQLIDISSDHEEDDGGSSVSAQREAERRKALLASQKNSQRKVFSGSRHLRTLSLLSPDKTYAPSFPQPLDLQVEEQPARKEPELPAPSPATVDLSKQLIDTGNAERYDGSGLPTIQREQLIRAGTQMAADLKNGLFTFIEDIRQATVGDEAVNGEGAASSPRDPLIKGARKTSTGRMGLNRSASTKKSSQNTGSFGDDFWKENGLSEPKTSSLLNKKTHTNKPAQTPQKQTRNSIEEEEWDNWETPNDTYKTIDAQDSSDESEAPSSPGPASSRTSTRYHSKRHDSKASSLTTTSSNGPDDLAGDSKRNSIPWADLVKLSSPKNLKQTASNFMKEWEKQLTPPPESRGASHGHGDYVGRSDSPSNLV